MPLELKLNFKAVSDDCKTVTLEDITGSYDAVDNPGGYGSPNPDRDQVALFSFAESYDSLTELYTQTNVLNTEPDVATEWEFNNPADLYYKTYLVAVPVFGQNTGNFYNQGDIVYEVGVGLFLCLINNASDAGTLPSQDPGTWAATNENEIWERIKKRDITPGMLDVVTSCYAGNCYGKATVKITSGITADNCRCTDDNRGDWQKVHVLWNGAVTLILQKRFVEAATVLATLADICEYLDCDCGC